MFYCCYLLALLQFIPGFGYRKARDFIQHLVSEGASMHNREDMKTVMKMGDVVFKNCNAFLSNSIFIYL